MTTEIEGQELTPELAAAEAARARADQPPGVDDGPARPSSHFRDVAAADRPDVLVTDDPSAEDRSAVANGTAEDDGDEWAAVTEWLLADESEVLTLKLKLRVGGTDADPKIIPWIIRAVGIDVIRSAEREAAGNRQQRRNGEGYDELKANLRVVVEGTVQPDLKAAARAKGLADPTMLVQRRFAFKPGLIAQIAGEIMSVSGFDADDVRAAGN